MRGLLALAVTVFIQCGIAPSQSVSGTIVVLHEEEPTRIVMAADSRAVRDTGGTRVPDDNDCKLLPLDKKTVFAATGLSEFTPKNKSVPLWNAYSLGQRVYTELSSAAKDLLPLRVALAWGDETQKFLNDFAEGNPTVFKELVAEHQIPPQAIIAGILPEGNVQVVWEKFTIAENAPRPVRAVHVEVPSLQVNCDVALGNFCGFGRSEIVDEYSHLTSDRAREEMKRWKKKHRHWSKEKQDTELTLKLAELTVQRDTSGLVGGGIDAVELKRGSKIVWIRRKANCPQ